MITPMARDEFSAELPVSPEISPLPDKDFARSFCMETVTIISKLPNRKNASMNFMIIEFRFSFLFFCRFMVVLL